MNGRALTAVTLNTWKNEGAYDRRLGWMAEELARLEPDIVLLQEAFFCREPLADTAGYVGRALGMVVENAPGRRKRRTFRGVRCSSRSDLAILSPLPLHGVERIQLPAAAGDSDRQVLSGYLTWHGLEVRVVTTHLTHLDEPAMRLAQAQRVRAFAEPPPRGLTLLGGDLNDLPSSAPVGVLARGPCRLIPLEADEGGTFLGAHARAHPNPRRIDYLFAYRSSDCHQNVIASEERIVLNCARGKHGAFPSDHAGVLLRLWVDTDGLPGSAADRHQKENHDHRLDET